MHGLMCDMCQMPRLHPYNPELANKHKKECLESHSASMEEAFALAKSVDKCCGICMENIMEKVGITFSSHLQGYSRIVLQLFLLIIIFENGRRDSIHLLGRFTKSGFAHFPVTGRPEHAGGE